MRNILNENDLEMILHKYYDLELSTKEIARDYNCSHQTIGRFIQSYGYTLRSQKEAVKTDSVKNRISKMSSDNWKNEEFRTNQVNKRTGRPSGALGKTWKVTTGRMYDVKGEKNPMWKGGKTKLSFAIKNTQKYKAWRNTVFERDNYTCQCCNRRSQKGDKVILECHHIKPFSIILNEYDIKTIDEALCCEELFDINNGQTLCKECHKGTDSYGINIKYAI